MKHIFRIISFVLFSGWIGVTRAEAVFQIEDTSITNGNFALQWDASASNAYNVYYTTSLTNSFQPLATNIYYPKDFYIDISHRDESCVFYKMEESFSIPVDPPGLNAFFDDATLLQAQNGKYLYSTSFKYPLIQVEGSDPYYTLFVADHVMVSFRSVVIPPEFEDWVESNGYIILEYSAPSDLYLIQTPAQHIDAAYQIIADVTNAFPTAPVALNHIGFIIE